MGVPKRRVSHARQGERRAHLAIDLPKLEECPHCHEMKLPHHVCPNCGCYQGRQAIELKPAGGSDRRRPALTRVTEPRPARDRGDARRRPRRRRRDGRRPRPVRGRPGALDFARSHPARHGDPRRRRGRSSGGIAGDAARQRPHRPRDSQVIGMDEHPALALREKKDASILVATDLVRRGEADAVVTAGHTGAGMAAAVLRLGRLPGVDRPALAVQMITESGPMVLLDIGANPDSTRREPRPVRAHGRDLRGAGAGRGPSRGSRCCRSARRRARATRGSRRRRSCSTRSASTSSATSRARTCTRHLADVVVCDAVARQRRHQVLRGPLDLHLRPVARRVPAARWRGRLAYLLMRPGIARIRDGLRLREGRRLAAARRQGHGRSSPTAAPGGG